MGQDYYNILMIRRSSSDADIRKAYVVCHFRFILHFCTIINLQLHPSTCQA